METNILSELQAIRQLLQQQSLQQKEIMSLAEACDYLNVSPSYIYKLTCTNQIPHYVPTGKKIYLKRSELDAWLLRNRQSSQAEIEKAASDYINYGRKGGRA